MNLRIVAATACFALPMSGFAQDAKLPRVVLLGDSIRMGYAPVVAKLLAGKAEIISNKANGGDSRNTLANLDKWAIDHKPDIVHFNCGIHDTKRFKASGKFQVSPEDYEANLRKIVDRLRKETKAALIFATTTPLHDERAAKGRAKAEYELTDAAIQQYNAIARKVMTELKVPINDLNAAIGVGDMRAKLLGGDGVHFSGDGTKRLADTVAAALLKHLP
jgi:lysophospholipase L1-like esterase